MVLYADIHCGHQGRTCILIPHVSTSWKVGYTAINTGILSVRGRMSVILSLQILCNRWYLLHWHTPWFPCILNSMPRSFDCMELYIWRCPGPEFTNINLLIFSPCRKASNWEGRLSLRACWWKLIGHLASWHTVLFTFSGTVVSLP